MNFTPDISLGQVAVLLVTVAIPTLGAIGAYFAMKTRVLHIDADTHKHTKTLDAFGTALADLRLHVSEQCVKKDDLEKVEERMDKRFDVVEHTIRNTSSQILAVLTGAGTRRGRGSV